MPGFYFENENASFTEKARVMGIGDYGVSRGSVTFDMENDGDLDLLIVNQAPVHDYPVPSTTRLFRNDAAKGNWCKIKLVGIDAERNGIGSRVELIANGKRMIREIDGGGSSHMSQNSSLAHFGLGNAGRIDTVKITWVGGKEQVLTNQSVNQLVTITEVRGRKKGNTWLQYLIIVLGLLGGLFW